MSLVDERGEASAPAVEHGGRPADAADRVPDFRGPFFSTKVAAAYVGNKSIKAFYVWANSHGIVRRNNGTIVKADLDRVLRRKRKRRTMHPASLLNLRKRRHGI